MRIAPAPGLFALVSVAGLLAGCQSTPASPKVERFAVIGGERVAPPAIKMGDPRMIEAIIQEGTENTQVLSILTEMTETFGPRLTGSAALENAQNWSVAKLDEWGLSDARLDEWGTIATRFDRGPSTATVHLPGNDDTLREMEFTTLAWTTGTAGAVRGPAVRMPATMAEYEANAGSYAGAWVLLKPDYSGRRGIRSVGFLMREHKELRHKTRQQLEGKSVESADETAALPAGQKWSGALDYNGTALPVDVVLTTLGELPQGVISLQNFYTGPIQDARLEGGVLTFRYEHSMGTSTVELNIEGDRAKGTSTSAAGNAFPVELTLAGDAVAADVPEFEDPILAKVLAENPAGFVSSSKDERVWTTSANGWSERELSDYARDVEVNVRQSDHDYINARLAQGVNVELSFDLQHTLVAGPIPVYNVFAEIRGSELPDEYIIISGHQDSWDGPGSQGVTDNGTGTSVMLEAARILAASGVKPKRSIKIALWSGEEQGLLGARAYVRSLSDEEKAKISAVFVDDGGTNYQGGIPAADFMVDYLAAATSWTNGRFYSETDGKELIVDIRPTGDKIDTHGGSDHAAFNREGIPGFFWDEVGRAEYRFGWHTQNDKLDLAIEEYLIQSAVNTAVTAYNLANAPSMLAREGDVAEDTETARATAE
jgi:hypothetical protein